MAKADLEEFEVDKSVDFNSTNPHAEKALAQAITLMGVYEVSKCKCLYI
jgi:hypothetical protein